MEVPSFAAELPLTRQAIGFAGRLHRGQRRVSDEAPFILHPLEAAIVFAADKLSKVRELRVRLSNLSRRDEPLPPEMERQLDHYIASLRMLENVIPQKSIVRQLRFELEALGEPPRRLP